MKMLEEMTSKELFSLRKLASTDELEEIDFELTRRDNLQQEEVGFAIVDEHETLEDDCCDKCKWVSQIESEREVKK